MDSQTLITIVWTILGALGTALLALVVWGLKKLITATFENTVQVKLLNQHIEKLLLLPPRVEKIERDLNVAHERIRKGYKNGEGP